MKTLRTIAITLILAAGCSASRPVPTEPAGCKLRLIFCPSGYRCNIATDLCEACSDGGPCDDAGAR